MCHRSTADKLTLGMSGTWKSDGGTSGTQTWRDEGCRGRQGRQTMVLRDVRDVRDVEDVGDVRDVRDVRNVRDMRHGRQGRQGRETGTRETPGTWGRRGRQGRETDRDGRDVWDVGARGCDMGWVYNVYRGPAWWNETFWGDTGLGHGAGLGDRHGGMRPLG